MFIANLHIVLCDVYINAHMVNIMNNNELLRYLMKYDDISILNGFYFFSQRLLLCILLIGDELAYTLHCDVLYDVNGCLSVNKCCV